MESTKSALRFRRQMLAAAHAHRWGNYWVDDGTGEDGAQRPDRSGHGDPEPNGSLRGSQAYATSLKRQAPFHFHRAVFKEDLGPPTLGAFALQSWVEKVRTGRNGRSAPSGRSEGSGRSVRDGHSARGGCCSCRGCDVAESAANMIAATSVEGGNARD